MSGRRHDPRVDPDSEPPSGAEQPSQVDRVFVPDAATSALLGVEREAPQPRGEVRNDDRRLATLEYRVKDNDWRGIVKDLGPLSDVGSLPPNLGLMSALAHHEVTEEGNQEAVAAGVRCIANILGVPEDGAMAGVIARRLFRKNPVRFRERQAPKARTSLIIVAVTLLLGGAVGWLSSGGSTTVLRLAHRVTARHR